MLPALKPASKSADQEPVQYQMGPVTIETCRRFEPLGRHPWKPYHLDIYIYTYTYTKGPYNIYICIYTHTYTYTKGPYTIYIYIYAHTHIQRALTFRTKDASVEMITLVPPVRNIPEPQASNPIKTYTEDH